MFINKKHLKIALICGILSVGILAPQNSDAGYAASSCDPEFFESLEARAYLEAQREIIQNQNLILKPDSVLEYSCFDDHLDAAVRAISSSPGMFSDDSSTYSTSGADIDGALDSIASLNDSYDTSNFNYKYLADRHSAGYDTRNSASSATYTCDQMSKAWQEAKCMDFIDESAHDGFYTFDYYESESDDLRRKPTAACTKIAFDDEMQKAVGTTTAWEEDDVVTYFEMFDRGGSTCDGTPHSSSITTGLVVHNNQGDTPYFEEHICLVPGCYWQPDSNTSATASAPEDDGDCVLP